MDPILVQMRNPAVKARQLRRTGMVPCVLYGAGLSASLSVQMEEGAARKLKQTGQTGSKADVRLEGTTYRALIQELDYNVRSDQVVHVSFYVPDPEKKVSSVADIVLLNADKVNGVLEQIQMRIPHAATPEHLLDTVPVDLERLPAGTTLTIGDIPAFGSDKIELLADPGSIVLRIRDRKRLGAPGEE